MSVTIFHNPKCSKSRQTLQLLRDKGVEPEIVEYLKSPPSAEKLKQLLQDLSLEPRDAMRKKEAPYEEQNLADAHLSNDQLIAAMTANPILIERPIVETDKGVRICRPPELVDEIT
jgi:arsenate reductase